MALIHLQVCMLNNPPPAPFVFHSCMSLAPCPALYTALPLTRFFCGPRAPFALVSVLIEKFNNQYNTLLTLITQSCHVLPERSHWIPTPQACKMPSPPPPPNLCPICVWGLGKFGEHVPAELEGAVSWISLRHEASSLAGGLWLKFLCSASLLKLYWSQCLFWSLVLGGRRESQIATSFLM